MMRGALRRDASLELAAHAQRGKRRRAALAEPVASGFSRTINAVSVQ
jgi:hypothetical protein